VLGNNLQYLRKKHGLSQQALSSALDIPRTTLGDYEREKTEPNIEMLLKMADYFNLDINTFLRKDLSHEQYEIAKSEQLKVLAISVDQENQGNIELVATKAEAGYLESYQNPEYIRDLPKLKIPGLDSGTYRAFEIQGESMLPIESESIIISSYVESLEDLKDGKTYIIISKKDGLAYKRIKIDRKRNCLILISDNLLYLPYELAFEDIDEIWQYYAHISFNDDRKYAGDKLENQISEINKKLTDIHDHLLD